MPPSPSAPEFLALESLLDRHPPTIAPDASVQAAFAQMWEQQSRYILVVQNQQLLGILTQADGIRLGAAGVNLAQTPVSEVITQAAVMLDQVITLDPSAAVDLQVLLAAFQQQQLQQLPIVDQQHRLIGVLTAEKLQTWQHFSRSAAQSLPHCDAPPNFELPLPETAQRQIEQERLMGDIAQYIRRSLNLDDILQTTVDRVRQFLNSDRVIIFRLAADRSGHVAVESVDPTWDAILSAQVHDPCFRSLHWESYRQGHLSAHSDIRNSGLQSCHVELLERFQVRANLVVPIVQSKHDPTTALNSTLITEEATPHLWGLLIAHHCAAPREWQPLERTLLLQLATQVAIAIQQSELYQQAHNELIERRRAEAALRENNERLTLALEAAQMGYLDWDLCTHRTIWTPYYEKILGYDLEERREERRVAPSQGMDPDRGHLDRARTSPSAHNWYERVYPEDLSRVEAALQTARDRHQAFDCEYRVVHPNQSVRWVTSVGRFYYDAAGEPIRMVGMIRDITDKKQLEAQFLRTQRLESLGTLSSGIAHDLNNVLTPILAAAQYLQLRPPSPGAPIDDRNQQMLKLLENNAKRGAELVKQVLSFARGVEGRRMPLQIGHLLTELEQITKRTFPKAIAIHTHIPTLALWTVLGDATQLHQVLMNLGVNAHDAMPEGGELTITAANQWVDASLAQSYLNAQAGSYVVITISDTGSGIPAEILDRIFDPFFTTKEVGLGTGLGLSTVVNIIDSHHGFIQVDSRVGQGTEFKVYLPAIQEPTIATVDLENQLPKGQGELILVVDDEASVREVTQTLLEDHHYRTITAIDGVDAIGRYTEHQQTIQLVLIDIMMPRMGGVTTIRALQSFNPGVKVIATSGLVTSHQLMEIQHLGVTTFLPKPYTTPDLLNAVQTILQE